MSVTTIYPAVEEAILDTVALKHIPVRLEFMVPAYRQFLVDLGEQPAAHLYPGMKVEPLFGVPVEIVVGPVKEWRLITD